MTVPALNTEARTTFDTIVDWTPPILRPERREKLARVVAWVMAERGLKEADKAAVVEAGRFISRATMKGRFDKLMGVEKSRTEAKAPYLELNAYYASPRIAERWQPVLMKPTKPVAEMKVLAFTSSNRRGGNTDQLVMEALRGARDAGAATELINVHDLKIGTCDNELIQRDYFVAQEAVKPLNLRYCDSAKGCKGPTERGECTLDDDMVGVYKKIAAADAMVIGIPCINGWEPAQLAKFMERWQRLEGCMYEKKAAAPRRGMVVATWGTLDPEAYAYLMENFVTKMGMRGFEVCEGIAACGCVGLLSGLDEQGKGIIARFPQEMAKAYAAGKTMVTGVL